VRERARERDPSLPARPTGDRENLKRERSGEGGECQPDEERASPARLPEEVQRPQWVFSLSQALSPHPRRRSPPYLLLGLPLLVSP
jgi:hypothetical protein